MYGPPPLQFLCGPHFEARPVPRSRIGSNQLIQTRKKHRAPGAMALFVNSGILVKEPTLKKLIITPLWGNREPLRPDKFS